MKDSLAGTLLIIECQSIYKDGSLKLIFSSVTLTVFNIKPVSILKKYIYELSNKFWKKERKKERKKESV